MTGVVVLGMHRSGTSVATRLLTLAGLQAARGSDDVAGDRWNPDGYFESRSLMDFNDRVLRTLGATWDAPPPPDAFGSAEHALLRLEQEANQTFAEAFPSDSWVWKDPRACVLLPFWDRVIGRRPSILVYRHPLEVAASLEARNGIELHHALALWERHNRQALAALVDRPAHVESYADLRLDPVAWSGRVRTFLVDCGFDTGEALDEDGLADLVATPATLVEGDDLRGLSEEQRDLWHVLGELAGRTVRSEGIIEAGTETAWVEELLTAHRRERRTALILDGSTEERDRAQRELAGARDELTATQGQLAAARAEAATLARSDESLRSDLLATQDELGAAQDELRTVRRQLEVANDELDVVLSSRSWRLTAVVRRARALFRR